MSYRTCKYCGARCLAEDYFCGKCYRHKHSSDPDNCSHDCEERCGCVLFPPPYFSGSSPQPKKS